MTLYEKLDVLGGKIGQSKDAARIVSELNYVASFSTAKGHKYDALVDRAADCLLSAVDGAGGVITRDAANETEAILLPLSKEIKSLRVHCVAHAHIDMNWMWGFQETASVTVDTFRTILDLMKEYPDFTYAQSQASTYKIIEDFAPEMLDEIRRRVHEGRWEISASTWVENDQNMPSGESMARQIFYTKRYLSKLLSVPADSMKLNFQPDTFGHNVTVPEICNAGGVKYYYHCRANEDHDFAYIWRARSGAELLVWFGPEFYNGVTEPNGFFAVPQLCEKYKLGCFLFVYGVGDHGGGPTRRDVERLIEMNTWPLMPTILFSTYHKFFGELETYRANLPVREGEINFVFTGCYTSQSRIKMANRMAEDRMFESEFLGAAANVLGGGPRYNATFGKAWEHILFNHFHDILPGSGVIDTREYALGQFQRAMAAIGTNANCAMRTLAAAIDTSAVDEDVSPDCISQGAGVGFMTDAAGRYGLPRAERGVGKKRVFHFFNPTQYDYDGVSDLTVWDWNYDARRAVITDPDGNAADLKIVADGTHYWSHYFKTFAVRVRVPALGYATYILDEAPHADNAIGTPCLDRADEFSDAPIVLENDLVRAVFDHATMQLVSFIDKKSGKETVSLPSANFRLIRENTVHGMAAWRVGDRMTVETLNETKNVRVYDVNLTGVRKWIRYDLPFGERSKLSVSVFLDDADSTLSFDVTCDFHEVGTPEKIPQLNFGVPVGYDVANYRYDVPFGTIDRPALEHDVPANSFAAAIPAAGEEAPALMLVSDSKYGFRGAANALELDLIRGSYEPDPYPEYGVHHIRIGICAVNGVKNGELFRHAAKFVHPIAACSARKGKGTLPLSGKLFDLSGNVHLSAVKTAEDFDGLAIRFSDESGNGSDVAMTFAKPVSAAYDADINENIKTDLPVSGNTVRTTVAPYAIKTVLVKF